jgi:hypothetical protein
MSCTVLGPATPQRDEALKAVKMIMAAAAQERGPRLPNAPARPFPRSWEALASSPAVGTWKTDGGPMGQLARKIRWGSAEPLPGWRMHWVSTDDAYEFTLSDTRDVCRFSYSADERELITKGVSVEPPFGVVPVDTSFR